jgi:integrase
VTGWRIIKRVMMICQIVGKAACPRGLRHAFGVGTLQAGVPLNLTSKWMGHSRLSTTAIYADACGPEEIAFAARFWNFNSSPDDMPTPPHAYAPYHADIHPPV